MITQFNHLENYELINLSELRDDRLIDELVMRLEKSIKYSNELQEIIEEREQVIQEQSS